MKRSSQGCILSPALFNVYSEFIFQEALDELKVGIKVNGQVVNNLRYADDTLILAENITDLKQIMESLYSKFEQYGLKINTSKTKYMVASKENNSNDTLTINGKPIEKVKKYRYLGVWLNECWDSEMEIRTRIEIARSAFIKMSSLYCNKDINLKLRWRLVKCYVLSILMYGVEAWTLNKLLINKLNAFEMWLYRHMLKITWTDKITNEKVLELMNNKKQEVVTTIKKRKTAYLGHIYRNSKYDFIRNIIEGKIEGRRGRGRPRTTWWENIKIWTGIKDAATLCRMAKEREEFRMLIADIR